jgi:hypothetical protein
LVTKNTATRMMTSPRRVLGPGFWLRNRALHTTPKTGTRKVTVSAPVDPIELTSR